MLNSYLKQAVVLDPNGILKNFFCQNNFIFDPEQFLVKKVFDLTNLKIHSKILVCLGQGLGWAESPVNH